MIDKPKQDFLRTRGIFTEVDKHQIRSKQTLHSAAAFLKNWDNEKVALKGAGFAPNIVRGYERLLDRGESGFTGGSTEELVSDLEGHRDLKPYHKAYKKYLETGITERLRVIDGFGKPKRKRRMSEYDGDWDFDRKWDLKPYQNCVRERSNIKTVKIFAHFTCRSEASSSSITEFGAFVWAASKIIEDSGYQVELNYRQEVTGASCRKKRFISDIEVKKPGEYISPQLLAACFTSNFYRRIGFGNRVLSIPVNKDDVCSGGMGGSVYSDTKIDYKNGELHIKYGAHSGSFDLLEIALLKLIKGGK